MAKPTFNFSAIICSNSLAGLLRVWNGTQKKLGMQGNKNIMLRAYYLPIYHMLIETSRR